MSDHNSFPPWTDLPQTLTGKLNRTIGMFDTWYKNYNLSRLALYGKLQVKLGMLGLVCTVLPTKNETENP